MGPLSRPRFAGCNAASIQKLLECWSQERYFHQSTDFINCGGKKVGVYGWSVAAILVWILTKAVLFPWCPPVLVPTTRVRSWGKHWGAVVTPAASARSTPEFSSKALPQGGVVVLATRTLGVHLSPTQKLLLMKIISTRPLIASTRVQQKYLTRQHWCWCTTTNC